MLKAIAGGILMLSASLLASSQSATSGYDSESKVFRLDGGNVSYVFGINSRGELQQIYWGGRLAASDRVPAATPMREWASFDSSYTNTPQEYAGWGSGLFVEPALKVTFASGDERPGVALRQPPEDSERFRFRLEGHQAKCVRHAALFH